MAAARFSAPPPVSAPALAAGAVPNMSLAGVAAAAAAAGAAPNREVLEVAAALPEATAGDAASKLSMISL